MDTKEMAQALQAMFASKGWAIYTEESKKLSDMICDWDSVNTITDLKANRKFLKYIKELSMRLNEIIMKADSME